PPVEPGEPFRYCELGCGVGKSAATVAATSPHAEVWGIDFNPAHIARGRRLSKEGGLDNLHLEDWTFADLAGAHSAALPRFHYIALHGVWSWISPENQRHIVDFIDAHLDPGGLVYITYNALPGWNNVAPMQRILRSLALQRDGHSDDRVAAALGLVRQMADAGAGALLPEQLSRLEEMSRKDDVAYVAHEYLNEHWRPCYQMDVAKALAPARLTFVGSANIFDNYPDVCLTKEQRELIDSSPLDLQETMRDFFMERTFRRTQEAGDIQMRWHLLGIPPVQIFDIGDVSVRPVIHLFLHCPPDQRRCADGSMSTLAGACCGLSMNNQVFHPSRFPVSGWSSLSRRSGGSSSGFSSIESLKDISGPSVTAARSPNPREPDPSGSSARKSEYPTGPTISRTVDWMS
ncbi:MAG: methyltransferase regulatory domain-containing protein, partial [Rhizobiales bacterium]|nr:methyltransferase regulatory domain-containing protein [Hyphomicrobiales bacterium]